MCRKSLRVMNNNQGWCIEWEYKCRSRCETWDCCMVSTVLRAAKCILPHASNEVRRLGDRKRLTSTPSPLRMPLRLRFPMGPPAAAIISPHLGIKANLSVLAERKTHSRKPLPLLGCSTLDLFHIFTYLVSSFSCLL